MTDLFSKICVFERRMRGCAEAYDRYYHEERDLGCSVTGELEELD